MIVAQMIRLSLHLLNLWSKVETVKRRCELASKRLPSVCQCEVSRLVSLPNLMAIALGGQAGLARDVAYVAHAVQSYKTHAQVYPAIAVVAA